VCNIQGYGLAVKITGTSSHREGRKSDSDAAFRQPEMEQNPFIPRTV
jgi:hypothetical protein